MPHNIRTLFRRAAGEFPGGIDLPWLSAHAPYKTTFADCQDVVTVLTQVACETGGVIRRLSGLACGLLELYLETHQCVSKKTKLADLARRRRALLREARRALNAEP